MGYGYGRSRDDYFSNYRSNGGDFDFSPYSGGRGMNMQYSSYDRNMLYPEMGYGRSLGFGGTSDFYRGSGYRRSGSYGSRAIGPYRGSYGYGGRGMDM